MKNKMKRNNFSKKNYKIILCKGKNLKVPSIVTERKMLPPGIFQMLGGTIKPSKCLRRKIYQARRVASDFLGAIHTILE